MSDEWHAERHRMRQKQGQALADVILEQYGPRPPMPNPVPLLDRERRDHRALAISLLKQRDGDNCYLCKQLLQAKTTVIEHIIPRCYGGTNDPANVALACAACNSRKADLYVSLNVTSGHPCYHRH